MSEAMQNMIEASLHRSLEMGEMEVEIATLRASLGQAEQAIAEMRGERGCNCESLLSRESDNISLRASLGRAVEAVEADQTLWQAANACDLCDPLVGLYCEEKHQAEFDRVDQLKRAVLSDPEGQRANQEWVAMREVCEVAVAYLGAQDRNLMAAIVTVGGGQKKEAKARALEMQACREALQDALRRLKEVQDA